jgi:hypothetical protein
MAASMCQGRRDPADNDERVTRRWQRAGNVTMSSYCGHYLHLSGVYMLFWFLGQLPSPAVNGLDA